MLIGIPIVMFVPIWPLGWRLGLIGRPAPPWSVLRPRAASSLDVLELQKGHIAMNNVYVAYIVTKFILYNSVWLAACV